MKILQFVIIALFTTAMVAQNQIEKDISAFTEIKTFDLIEVELIKSDKNQVVISGFNIDNVKVTDEKGTLKIRMNIETRFSGDDTQVKVYYTEIETIDANEGSEITSAMPLKQENIIIKTQEGGSVKVQLDVKEAEFRAVSGGVITVSGTVNTQEIVINSGGAFNGKKLQAKETKVKVMAGGSADVNTTDILEAKVTAGGNIYVYGNPKDVKKNKFAGGKIVMKQ
ncbi:MAG: hypothetical protein ACI849_000022 [Patiriisocius sp.]|jgi:hypothetical protein